MHPSFSHNEASTKTCKGKSAQFPVCRTQGGAGKAGCQERLWKLPALPRRLALGAPSCGCLQQGSVPSTGSRRESIFLPVKLLTVLTFLACSCQQYDLLVLSTHLLWLWPSFIILFKDPCDYSEPTQTTQEKASIVRSLTESHLQSFFYPVGQHIHRSWELKWTSPGRHCAHDS